MEIGSVSGVKWRGNWNWKCTWSTVGEGSIWAPDNPDCRQHI